MSSFKDSIKKYLLTNSIISKTLNRNQDLNRTQGAIINLRNRPQLNNSKQNKLLDMTTIGIPGGHKSKHSEFFEEEVMKILLKENFSNSTKN